MNHLSIMVKELTDEFNNIVADMEYIKDEDTLEYKRIRAGIILEKLKKLLKGVPIVLYDSEMKQPYLLHQDGRREY